MRTIKFRGKTKQGEWVTGYYVGKSSLNEVAILPPQNVNYDIGYINDSECYYCIADTIGQFTGLYDKNGKEIYEGDILRFGNIPGDVCEVKWNERITAFCIRFYFECNLGVRPLGEWVICERSVAIIGNIHDNPELLKGGEK